MNITIDLKKCKEHNALNIRYADNFKGFQAKNELFETEEEWVEHLKEHIKVYLLPFKIADMDTICVDNSTFKPVVYIGDLREDDIFCHDFLIEKSSVINGILEFDTDHINLFYEDNFIEKIQLCEKCEKRQR